MAHNYDEGLQFGLFEDQSEILAGVAMENQNDASTSTQYSSSMMESGCSSAAATSDDKPARSTRSRSRQGSSRSRSRTTFTKTQMDAQIKQTIDNVNKEWTERSNRLLCERNETWQAKLDQTVAEFREKCEEQQGTISEYVKEVEKLKAQLNSRVCSGEEAAGLKGRAEKAEAKAKELEKNLERVRREHDQTGRDFRQMKEKYEREITDYKAKIDEERKAATEAREKASAIEKSLAEANDKNDELRRAVEEAGGNGKRKRISDGTQPNFLRVRAKFPKKLSFDFCIPVGTEATFGLPDNEGQMQISCDKPAAQIDDN